MTKPELTSHGAVSWAISADNIETRLDRLAEIVRAIYQNPTETFEQALVREPNGNSAVTNPSDSELTPEIIAERLVRFEIIGVSEMGGRMDLPTTYEHLQLFAEQYDGFNAFNSDEKLMEKISPTNSQLDLNAVESAQYILSGLYLDGIKKRLSS